MNRMGTAERRAVLACLVEGCSIRSTCRMTGAAKGTVLKLLADLGTVCASFHDEAVRDLVCEKVQVDELWAFNYCKARTASRSPTLSTRDDVGDVWTWTGMDADTKLMVTWYVGDTSPETAHEFAHDLAARVRNRIQLTTDGNRHYYTAIRDAFGDDVDYAMCKKIYGDPKPDGRIGTSQLTCVGVEKKRIIGNPDMDFCSTSYLERQNLTVRMCSRRFTRLTNAFSRKLENLCHALAIHYVYYNFVRVHQTLKTTPAMAAGIADRVWKLDDMVALLEAREQEAIAAGSMKRGKYRPRQPKPISN